MNALPARADTAVRSPSLPLHWLVWLRPAGVIGLSYFLYATLDPAQRLPAVDGARFVLLGAILFAAGFVSGLAGFAFSAVGATILLVINPILAVPLLQGLSAVNQAISISQLRGEMPAGWRQWWPSGPGPAIVGGLAGAPVGVWILNHVSAPTLTLLIGLLITGYALFSLLKPAGLILRGCDGVLSGLVVGLLGGAIGGFTAFPGVAVVVWTALRDTPKTVTRGLVQPYVLALQIVSLATNGICHPSTFDHRYWILFAFMLPIVLPGTLTGVSMYRSISDKGFKLLCLGLLVISGAGLILKAAF